MAIQGRIIFRNTTLLYLRMLLLLVVSLYTSRVILSALGVIDFGLYNVVGGLISMIGFMQGTMSTASSRFITVSLTYGDREKMSSIFSSIFQVNALFAIIIVIIAETIGLWFLKEKMNIPVERESASVWVYQLSIISVVLSILSVPYNASIIAHERMGAFAYISIFDAFAKLSVAFLIQTMSYDRLIVYSSSLVMISFIDIIIYILYCNRNFIETRLKFYYNNETLFSIFKFMGWSSYGSFVSVSITQGLNIILNLFFGPAVNAARGIAVQVQSAVTQFTNNFQTALNPQMTKAVASDNMQDARILLVSGSKLSFFIISMIGIPILLNTSYILELWLKNTPEHCMLFCQIMIVIGMVNSLANPLRIINQAEGNIKQFQLFECTLLILIIPSSLIALKLYTNPEIVFFINLIIELLCQFIRMKIVLPKIQMKNSEYINHVVMKIVPSIIIPVLFVVVFEHIVNFGGFIKLVVDTGLSLLVMLLSIFFTGLNLDEKRIVTSYVKKIIYNNE